MIIQVILRITQHVRYWPLADCTTSIRPIWTFASTICGKADVTYDSANVRLLPKVDISNCAKRWAGYVMSLSHFRFDCF